MIPGGGFDKIEIDLNKEVDSAISQMSYGDEHGPFEELNTNDLIEMITRIAGEIQQVVSLLKPKSLVNDTSKELPQDPTCARVTKELLITQTTTLQRLINQLE